MTGRPKSGAGAIAAGCASVFAAAVAWTLAGGPACSGDECSSNSDCDDGVFCNGAEVCFRGRCARGRQSCDDGLICTRDECDETTRSCVRTPIDYDGDTYTDAECGGEDCNDRSDLIHPGADEACNGADDDCDGATPDDRDGDRHLNIEFCPAEGDDCDDDDPTRYPGAPEPCDGVDRNCSGDIDDERDTDGDTAVDPTCGGDDCDDENPDVRPGAEESCNGRDDDCDGATDEVFPCRRRETDVLCWTDCGTRGSGRCTDTCALPRGDNCRPGEEICFNDIDDDCDGEADEGCDTTDGGCAHSVEFCDNGADDDCDGTTDEADCRRCPICQPGAFRHCDTGLEWGWGLQACSSDGMSWGTCFDDVAPPGCPRGASTTWDLACCMDSHECCRRSSGESVGLGCRPAPPCD